MKISAAIFDLNGTILTDEDEYGLAFGRVLTRLGAKKVGLYPQEAGIGVEENWPILLKKFNLTTTKSPAELAAETQKEYLKLLPRVSLKEGFLEVVKIFKDSGVKVALATSNTWMIVEVVLDKFNLADLFDVITTKEELVKNKPDPEIYSLTAQKLDLPPADCLVFEDSAAGIESARAAGMQVVGVARNNEHAEKLQAADTVIQNYSRLV